MRIKKFVNVLRSTIFVLLTAIFVAVFAIALTACDEETTNSPSNGDNGTNIGGNEQELPDVPGETETDTPKPEEVFYITFYPNNGDDCVVWKSGDTVPLPTRNGYAFDGWYYDESLTVAYTNTDFSNLKLLKNFEAYAKWKKQINRFENLTFDDAVFVYDSNPHGVYVQNLPQTAQVAYDSANAQTEVGTYTINAAVSADGYETAYLEARLSILQADLDGIIFEDGTFTYDGTAKNLEIKRILDGVERQLPQGVSVTYLNNSKSDAGTYAVTAVFDAGNNYKPLQNMCASLTISQAVIEALAFMDAEFIWDGSLKTLGIVYAPNGVVGTLPKGVSVSYENNSNSDAGVYDVKAVFKTDKNYRPIPEMSAILTIKPAVFDGISFKDAEFVWDGACKNLTVEYFTDGAKTPLPDAVSVAYENNNQSEVGEYIVTARFTLSSNYAPIAPMKAKLTITEKLYLVRFHYSDTEIVEVKVERGQKLGNLPPLPQKQGYTTVWNPDNLEYLTDDVTDVYAQYFPIVYEIGYVLNGGRFDSAAKMEYTVEDDTFLVTVPEYAAHDFSGWYAEEDFSGRQILSVEKGSCGNKTFYAKWTETQYTLEYVLQNCENSAENPKKYSIKDCPLTLQPADANKGYEFLGWYTDGAFENKIETISADTIYSYVLYALTREKEYLEYALLADGTYAVSGVKDGAENVIVPSTYNGAAITKINAYAFKNSTLTSVTLGDAVKVVEAGAFENCASLKSVYVSTGVTSLPRGLFKGCRALEAVTIPFVGEKASPTSADEIYTFGFLFAKETDAASYYGVTQTYDSAEGKTLQVDLPLSLKKVTVLGGNIVNSAFENCAEISEIVINGNARTISLRAFDNCAGLTTLYIPAVEEIQSKAFNGCVALTKLFYSGTLEQWHSVSIGKSGNAVLKSESLEITTL